MQDENARSFRRLRVVLDRNRGINTIEDADGEYIIVGELIIAMLGDANFTLGDQLLHHNQGIAVSLTPSSLTCPHRSQPSMKWRTASVASHAMQARQ